MASVGFAPETFCPSPKRDHVNMRTRVITLGCMMVLIEVSLCSKYYFNFLCAGVSMTAPNAVVSGKYCKSQRSNRLLVVSLAQAFVAFLWRALRQSGFIDSAGECDAITNRWFGESDLTFTNHSKHAWATRIDEDLFVMFREQFLGKCIVFSN